MIEHKLFDMSTFKKAEDVAVELDKLSYYEGWLVVCTCGKKNNILVLRRVLEQQQVPQQQTQRQPAKRGTGKVKTFPDAVFQ